MGNDAVLVHNTGWCDALKVLKDKTATKAYTKAVANGISESMVHAHHIVMKGATEGKLITGDTIKAQAILSKYGVDLLDGTSAAAKATGNTGAAAVKKMAQSGDKLENLCCAIRDAAYYEKTLKLGQKRGLHSAAYQKKVFDNLNNVVTQGLSRKLTAAEIADGLKKELQRMGKILENGKAFW